MRSPGPKQGPPSYGTHYYCRPCNRVVSGDPKVHAQGCRPLHMSASRANKEPFELLIRLRDQDCPNCYLGFKNGNNYCPVCGNTKEPALDDTGRRRMFGRPKVSGQDLVEGTKRDSSIPPGWYRIKVGRATFEARVLGKSGPRVILNGYGRPESGGRGVWTEHALNVESYEPIEEPHDYLDWYDKPQETPGLCECGHPEHNGQCYHTERFETKPYVRRCQCGAPTASDIRAQFSRIMGNG